MISAMWGVGEGGRLRILGEVAFPHSLGVYYTAVTQFLGFPKYGDEYKVMGLASYGEPTYLDEFRQIVHSSGLGYDLNLDAFRHHIDGAAMTWDGGSPELPPLWGPGMEELLGPARTAPESRSRSDTRTSPHACSAGSRRSCSACSATCTPRPASTRSAWPAASHSTAW